MASEQYGDIHTGNLEFEAAYVLENSASSYISRRGRLRPRALHQDLIELVDRGLAVRLVRNGNGVIKNVRYSYFFLTEKGRAEAYKLRQVLGR